jgi:uncharacterized repeat protein (TIGR01451 family)
MREPARVFVCVAVAVLATTSIIRASGASRAASPGAAGTAADWAAGRVLRAQSEPIIIDHTCTDLSKIPSFWIERAKDLLRVFYGHTSHGSQPVTGMRVIMNNPSYGGLYDFTDDGSVLSGQLSLDDHYADLGDLGNPNNTEWEQRTREYLDSPAHADRNVVVWSWCGQVSGASPEYISTYLSLMDGLEADYPDVTFVYMTGHLNGTGEEGNLHQRNNQIRDHVTANNGVLFDFADIESYDPDHDYFLDRGADDGCDYDGGNWATEWCAANSSDPLCAACGCAHSQALNCNLKGRAFWWMMARLAGWSGPGEPVKASSTTTPVTGDVVTYTVLLQNVAAPVSATIYLTDTLPSALVYISGTLAATAGQWSDAAWPTLTWIGTLSETSAVTITYAATVTAAAPLLVENTAEIVAPGHAATAVTSRIIVNPWPAYLPAVFRDYP